MQQSQTSSSVRPHADHCNTIENALQAVFLTFSAFFNMFFLKCRPVPVFSDRFPGFWTCRGKALTPQAAGGARYIRAKTGNRRRPLEGLWFPASFIYYFFLHACQTAGSAGISPAARFRLFFAIRMTATATAATIAAPPARKYGHTTGALKASGKCVLKLSIFTPR